MFGFITGYRGKGLWFAYCQQKPQPTCPWFFWESQSHLANQCTPSSISATPPLHFSHPLQLLGSPAKSGGQRLLFADAGAWSSSIYEGRGISFFSKFSVSPFPPFSPIHPPPYPVQTSSLSSILQGFSTACSSSSLYLPQPHLSRVWFSNTIQVMADQKWNV